MNSNVLHEIKQLFLAHARMEPGAEPVGIVRLAELCVLYVTLTFTKVKMLFPAMGTVICRADGHHKNDAQQ